jgi:hypothetical protein
VASLAAPVRLLAVALALLGVIALSTPVAASAKQPCWKDVLDDWYPDGRIDGSYSQACYRAADQNLPQDLRDYSDLPNAIARARLRDVRDSRVENDDRFPQSVGGAGPVDERDDDGSGGGGNSGDGAIGEALDQLGPSSADSAPIPLLILAGLALLLVAAGGAGVLTRRIQARRARVDGPPPGPQV